MGRGVKREAAARIGEDEESGNRESSRQELYERRVLRSRYLAVKTLISDEKEDITKIDSDKFDSIFTEVENLHQQVRKPREQVADAEALLDIATTIATSVKSQSNDGVTPSDFVSALLRNFGQQDDGSMLDNSPSTVSWSDVGIAVSHIFKKAYGSCTMLGPMTTEMKQRKQIVQKKRTKPTTSARPEELDDAQPETKTDTDKNMAIMFNILRRNKTVRLENLILNRDSFAQTVENIFALSFLVKDGRAEVTIDNGHHVVSPKNAPPASAVSSGEVTYNHFVFRFDFRDWQLMKESTSEGEELMPHRTGSQSEVNCELQHDVPRQATPIRKFTRNRGLTINENAVVEDSLEKGSPPLRGPSQRQNGKRLFEE